MADTGKKKQLGKILLKQKLVTPDELDELLVQQKTTGARLASAAVDAGKVDEKDLLRALGEQHGLPGIDLDHVVIPISNLGLIPVDIAKQHLILPFEVKDERVGLAMADPGDRRVIDEIEFVTGRRVFPHVALHEHLAKVIEGAYAQAERGEEYFIGRFVTTQYLQSLGIVAPDRDDSLAPAPRPENASEDASGALGDAIVYEDNSEFDGIFDQLELGDEPDDGLTPIPKSLPGQRILIVDDEDDIRRLLRRVFEEKGYVVIEATKGSEALHSVRSETPDLILLDAMLPEVHGFDICRRIKGSKRYGHIPIVMVSAVYRGWRFAEDLRESYGVDAFLEKPFKIAEVVAAVEAALQGKTPDTGDEELTNEAGEAFEKGIKAYQDGDLDQAIEQLNRGVQIDPLSFKLHYHLGLLHGRRDEVFEAIHELETAVDLSPRHFSALKNLAVLFQRAGFKHKAVEMWERALSSAPDDATRQGIKEHLVTLL